MKSPTPTISIVIPAYNRVGPLHHTLASAERAADQLGEAVEIILVDDGSEPPLTEVFDNQAQSPRLHILRQPNQGSIVARLTGLHAACGEFVLFLDSDDLIATGKLTQHIVALRTAAADISYDDLGASGTEVDRPEPIATRSHLARAGTVEELLLRVQPVPHSPIYRRDYLLRALAAPTIPPLRKCDAVGDIWLYYNLCIHPARVVKVDAPLTLIGVHEEARYSQHWERLGFAALGVAENFMRRCPETPATANARRLVGERAFDSWRRLPRGFAPEYCRRLLAVWRAAPGRAQMRLGGPAFGFLSKLFGPVGAGRLLRLRNTPYGHIRTIDDAELARLLEQQY
jgi:glycosyltransferase involved in cell wall biosynthesis